MRAKNIRLLISLIIVAVAVIGFFIPGGKPLDDSLFGKLLSNITLGLDIRGGSSLEYGLDLKNTKLQAKDVVDNVVFVLRKRLDAAGFTEATVDKIVSGSDFRVRVEIPGISDTAQAEKLIGSRGKLYFAEVAETTTTDKKPEITRNRTINVDGKDIDIYDYAQSLESATSWFKVKKVFEFGSKPFEITGIDISDARPQADAQRGGFEVTLAFNPDGARKFEIATGNLIEKRIAIILDDKVIIAPTVQGKISGGNAVINGIQTVDEAKNVAALIKGGNLPVDLIKFQERSLGPTLGKDIVDTILRAGLIGAVIVMLYMIVFYGWMGFIADINLLYILTVILGFLAWTKSILTLPGIAGILLTFGTGVDGNVIIYERIKEELRAGRPVGTAVNLGFDKAFWTLFDSNLTTIITGVILYYFATGPVRGFAITLIVGILACMFTNLVFSRLLLEFTSGMINVKKFHKDLPQEDRKGAK